MCLLLFQEPEVVTGTLADMTQSDYNAMDNNVMMRPPTSHLNHNVLTVNVPPAQPHSSSSFSSAAAATKHMDLDSPTSTDELLEHRGDHNHQQRSRETDNLHKVLTMDSNQPSSQVAADLAADLAAAAAVAIDMDEAANASDSNGIKLTNHHHAPSATESTSLLPQCIAIPTSTSHSSPSSASPSAPSSPPPSSPLLSQSSPLMPATTKNNHHMNNGGSGGEKKAHKPPLYENTLLSQNKNNGVVVCGLNSPKNQQQTTDNEQEADTWL